MDVKSILAQSDIARGMEVEQLDKLAAIARAVDFKKNDILIKENDTSSDIFILYKGWISVEIQRFPYDTTAQRLRVLKNKGVLGEFSFIDKSRRSANVRAQENVSCVVLPGDELEKLTESDAKVGFVIMKNIARLLSEKVRSSNFELRNQLIW
ncbi:MAG: cyclic nucleotide-binding domain-containing protein [Nitrospinota bacterium]|nr:cyclic nucleotide-binding domain-containing protein [Nitrospinota bacterium]